MAIKLIADQKPYIAFILDGEHCTPGERDLIRSGMEVLIVNRLGSGHFRGIPVIAKDPDNAFRILNHHLDNCIASPARGRGFGTGDVLLDINEGRFYVCRENSWDLLSPLVFNEQR